MIRAAAKNHAGVVVLVDPGQYAPVLEELRRSGGSGVAGDAAAAGARGVPAHGAVRRGHRRVAPGARSRDGPGCRRCAPLPAGPASRRRAGGPPALRREPAPARRLLPAGRPGARGRGSRRAAPAPRSRAVVQQSPRPRRGARPPRRVHRAGGRRREAHESLRGRGGADVVAAFARARASDPVSIYGGIVGVNRPVDRAPRGRAVRHPARDPLRAGLRAGRPRGAPADQEEAPRARASRGPAPGRRRAARAPQRARGDSWSRRRTWSASTRWPSRW